MKNQKLTLCLVSLVVFPALLPAAESITDEQANFFERKIRPVLVEKCYECHSAQSKKVKGDLMLDTREATLRGGNTGPAVVPGSLDESLLITAIQWSDKDMQMPPKTKLPASVIADFQQWIKMGAPDPRAAGAVTGAEDASKSWKKTEINLEEGRKFWAFQAPKSLVPPEVNDKSWAKSGLDKFVQAKLEEKNITPVPEASKLELLRRVTFDLTGLPLSPDAITAFMQDSSSGAFTRVVDGLLASPRFGEKWGRHWLDVARYGESSGKDVNLPYPFAWRYRDWVIEAMNGDMPYDEFVRQQIAGDLLPYTDAVDQSKKIVATGFLAIGSKPHNERNPRQFALEVVDEQIDTLSQAILGITVACARCHDHKFDPIPQKDYYALAGVFLSSDTLYGTSNAVQNNHPTDLIDLGKESRMAAGYDGITADERASIAEKVRQFNETKDEKTREAMMARRNGKEADVFKLLVIRQQTGDLVASMNRYDVTGAARVLAMGVYDRKTPVNSAIYGRGEAAHPGETVPRGLVQVFFKDTPKPIEKGSGRLEVAQWLSGKDNPQTARVMVNRMWRWLFGSGIVATVDNFGAMGEKPSHPELLDYLAIRFMENGWSIKKMVREIVLSSTYQLAAQHSAANYAVDPENTLHWRMNSRSLDAESLRDAMLAVSGKLDLNPPAGSPVCRVGEGREGLIKLVQAVQQPSNHRSVYLPIVRDQVPEVLSLFDFANPGIVTGDREKTNVPSQSLYLLNNAQVQALSDAFARRVYESARDDNNRIMNAWLLAYGRPATAQEQRAARDFFSNYNFVAAKSKQKGADISIHAWSAFCQSLLASAEFRYLN